MRYINLRFTYLLYLLTTCRKLNVVQIKTLTDEHFVNFLNKGSYLEISLSSEVSERSSKSGCVTKSCDFYRHL